MHKLEIKRLAHEINKINGQLHQTSQTIDQKLLNNFNKKIFIKKNNK